MKTFNHKDLDDWASGLEPQKDNRIVFLTDEMNYYRERTLSAIQNIRRNDSWNKDNPNHWYTNAIERNEVDIEAFQKKIKGLEYHLAVAKGEVKARPQDITPEMIEQAKLYPIRELIHSTNDVITRCPFHNDNRASLNIQNNFAFCHGCGWTGDTIKIYQTIHSATFPEAVKYLSKM